MTQRDVRPQAQSLCFTVHARQLQNSHQIHLRWFTSRTKRATIQMRISVRDTLVQRIGASRRGAMGHPAQPPRLEVLETRNGAKRP